MDGVTDGVIVMVGVGVMHGTQLIQESNSLVPRKTQNEYDIGVGVILGVILGVTDTVGVVVGVTVLVGVTVGVTVIVGLGVDVIVGVGVGV